MSGAAAMFAGYGVQTPPLPHVADSNARLSLTPEGVVVSGAGTDPATNGNGFYWQSASQNNGKPYWYRANVSGDVGPTLEAISWNGSRWRIYGATGTLYQSTVADTDVWDATFSVTGGDSPPPTVTHSPGQVTGAGYQVIQDDDGLTYTFNGDGADADAGLRVTGAGTTAWNDAYESPAPYSGINNGLQVADSGLGSWTMGGLPQAYASSDFPTYPWQATWTVVSGDSPAPTVQRNPICSEANWSHP